MSTVEKTEQKMHVTAPSMVRRAGLSAILAAGLALPATALTVDEVVAKHIDARGGKEAWQSVGNVKVTGSFTAFSQINPFTLNRATDGRYHLDHMLGDKLVVIGWDGETAWWENHWFQEGAQEISGVDHAVVIRDIEYPLTPFFHLEEAGHKVKLLGESDVEGTKTLGIELTRADGSTETWFLDPDTFLEVARDSPGSDFGQPMSQRTFFDAFETVGDSAAVMPHYVETQWYTRHRVMEVESVETGVDIADDLFRMPAPLGMAPVLAMAGTWNVAVERRQRPDSPWSSSTATSTITAELGRAMLREEMASENAAHVRTLSFDRFRKHYVLTWINDQTAFLDVLHGTLEDGAITLDNQETGTTLDMFGMNLNGRVTIKDVSDGGFTLEHETSIDGGENWFQDIKLTYTPANGG